MKIDVSQPVLHTISSSIERPYHGRVQPHGPCHTRSVSAASRRQAYARSNQLTNHANR
jgi:hypothetical protein